MTDLSKLHIAGRIEGFGFDGESIAKITGLVYSVDGILTHSVQVSLVDNGDIPGCSLTGNVADSRFVADEVEQVLRDSKFTNSLVFQVNPAELALASASQNRFTLAA